MGIFFLKWNFFVYVINYLCCCFFYFVSYVLILITKYNNEKIFLYRKESSVRNFKLMYPVCTTNEVVVTSRWPSLSQFLESSLLLCCI